MARWRLFVVVTLITSSLLVACGGRTGTDTAAKETLDPPPPAQTAPAPTTPPKSRSASPQVLEVMLEEALAAAGESRWTDANQYTVKPDALPEESEPTWKGIINSYYRGDAKQIQHTRVKGVQRNGDDAIAKIATPASPTVTVVLEYRESGWVIVDFGDHSFQ